MVGVIQVAVQDKLLDCFYVQTATVRRVLFCVRMNPDVPWAVF